MRGRPKSDNSREKQYRVRLNEKEALNLDYVSSTTGQAKSDIIRKALNEYLHKVQINEYNLSPENDDLIMEGINMQRVLKCPYCGKTNIFDFTDLCNVSSYERQMGTENLYEFDEVELICTNCNKKSMFNGYISEYPLGAFNGEEIKVAKLEEEE